MNSYHYTVNDKKYQDCCIIILLATVKQVRVSLFYTMGAIRYHISRRVYGISYLNARVKFVTHFKYEKEFTLKTFHFAYSSN